MVDEFDVENAEVILRDVNPPVEDVSQRRQIKSYKDS